MNLRVPLRFPLFKINRKNITKTIFEKIKKMSEKKNK